MNFRITGLEAKPFQHLYGLSDDDLRGLGVVRVSADSNPGYPDRIEMRDADIGESLLLLNHVCQSANTPYRASHAVFVREGAVTRYDRCNEVPDVLRRRLLSLRAYDADGMMLDAEIVDGEDCETLIEKLFANGAVAYIHAHNAKRGCYAARS
jgi:hypothetical protein